MLFILSFMGSFPLCKELVGSLQIKNQILPISVQLTIGQIDLALVLEHQAAHVVDLPRVEVNTANCVLIILLVRVHQGLFFLGQLTLLGLLPKANDNVIVFSGSIQVLDQFSCCLGFIFYDIVVFIEP